ncbi:type VII toxin-antitoxin system MntA family adenylyltransferase antitoxin [Alloalcanivorax mobilis]|uniref:type VII toxin-antitoxin system MntA family adenylyltransferase antitoxin n=1 Tax=Alloalcanivorax mobilis TaxID=2019569 RepID=UPI000B5B0FCE|nr:nucleotidyltransferase domain-containing protein [Alloalcanivorax mobilis]ASK34839.1 DNA polymerase subunit beta [Alcanivorax sp. N3-2A]|tara:strand:+ start:5074 stop:5475 length:402 start_codon:yes stop_codon:yes gene_type:complete
MTHTLEKLISLIRRDVAGLRAVFLFGSEADGSADRNSDLDIAVLSDHALDPVALWELSSRLAEVAHRDVDLVDLGGASTVMKFQIVSKGKLLWQADHAGDLFTTAAQREYWDWEIIRRPIIDRIKESGSIYGR